MSQVRSRDVAFEERMRPERRGSSAMLIQLRSAQVSSGQLRSAQVAKVLAKVAPLLLLRPTESARPPAWRANRRNPARQSRGLDRSELSLSAATRSAAAEPGRAHPAHARTRSVKGSHSSDKRNTFFKRSQGFEPSDKRPQTGTASSQPRAPSHCAPPHAHSSENVLPTPSDQWR